MEKITKIFSQKYNKRFSKSWDEENKKKEERVNNWLESKKIFVASPEEKKINYFNFNKKQISGASKENFLNLRNSKILQKRSIKN